MTTKTTLTTSQKHQACFVAGTLVHTKDGLKPIQEIKVGDMVLSKPEDGSGKAEYKPVLNTFKSPEKEEVFKVEYYGNDGLIYLLCTANHPFWVTKQPDSKSGAWIEAKDLPAGFIHAVSGDSFGLSDYAVLPVRTLPYFPEGCAYTQNLEEHDLWNTDDSAGNVIYLRFEEDGYHFISLDDASDKRQSIRSDYGRLEAIEPLEILSLDEPIATAPELFQFLDVLLSQDMDVFYRSKDIYLNKMHSPFELDGEVIKENCIFDEELFNKALARLEKYGVDMGSDYGESIHLSMENYYDKCPNPFKAHVYNLEVADYHTYFVGHDGIWVHNCDPSTINTTLEPVTKPCLPKAVRWKTQQLT